MANAGLAPMEFLVPGLPYAGPELRGMELSGLIVHVIGDLYVEADPLGSGATAPMRATGVRAAGVRMAEVRAAAVVRLAAPVIAGRWAAMGLTAAWVFTGGQPPTVLEASVERFHRIPLQPLSVGLRFEQSDAADQPSEIVDVFGLSCTSVERTLEDLLRSAGDTRRAEAAMAAAARLLPLADPVGLRSRFESRRKRPGMAAARRALERLLRD
ncbi:hypothetical protein F7P69_07020 [Cellulosimicrobium funkei]|nr:hypothetical protein [Cellulosimicrobium funkei]